MKAIQHVHDSTPMAQSPQNNSTPGPLSITRRRASWFFQVLAAVLIGQTLFFKFTGAEESVAIFSMLGLEPLGRFGIALAELAAVILLLWPRLAAWGAMLTIALMVGATAAHATALGFEGSMGELWAMGAIAMAAAFAVFFLRNGLNELGRLPIKCPIACALAKVRR